MLLKKVILATAIGSALIAAGASAAVATGDTSKDKIALSNSYAGNTFRQLEAKLFFVLLGADYVCRLL